MYVYSYSSALTGSHKRRGRLPRRHKMKRSDALFHVVTPSNVEDTITNFLLIELANCQLTHFCRSHLTVLAHPRPVKLLTVVFSAPVLASSLPPLGVKNTHTSFNGRSTDKVSPPNKSILHNTWARINLRLIADTSTIYDWLPIRARDLPIRVWLFIHRSRVAPRDILL